MSNMYEEMTDKNINPLLGECSHWCAYCYVKAMKQRYPAMRTLYSGPPRISEKVLRSTVKGGVRFLCSCNDLFAADVPDDIIMDVVDWAARQDTVTWWVQTKNPAHPLFRQLIKYRPDNFRLGTTIETNRDNEDLITDIPGGPKLVGRYSQAPRPTERCVEELDYVTIEPIMDFDIVPLVDRMRRIHPKWINIGADSSKPLAGLPEPTEKQVVALVSMLTEEGFDVRLKPNLSRIAPSLFSSTKSQGGK